MHGIVYKTHIRFYLKDEVNVAIYGTSRSTNRPTSPNYYIYFSKYDKIFLIHFYKCKNFIKWWLFTWNWINKIGLLILNNE